MWIPLALVAAVGAATTSLLLKQAVAHGGAIVSTVVFRAIAGLVLTGVVWVADVWPSLTPGYWRAAALVMPPEVGGMLCLSLALRAGELSLVQPLLGLVPLFATIGGIIFLNEVPTPLAGAGILLLTAGIYRVGLGGGGSVLAPLRALGRSRASWYAVGAALCWSVTTILHKVGIAEVGAFPWAVTLTLGSALVLASALPFVALRSGTVGVPLRPGRWAVLVAAAGLVFAVQQAGLQLSMGVAHAGYVVALASTSTVVATLFGIVLLGERAAARNRITGGVLVTGGAVLIALFG